MDGFNKVLKIAATVAKLTDEDIADADAVIKAQEEYTHPLKNATAAKTRSAGEHNRKILEGVKSVLALISEAKAKHG